MRVLWVWCLAFCQGQILRSNHATVHVWRVPVSRLRLIGPNANNLCVQNSVRFKAPLVLHPRCKRPGFEIKRSNHVSFPFEIVKVHQSSDSGSSRAPELPKTAAQLHLRPKTVKTVENRVFRRVPPRKSAKLNRFLIRKGRCSTNKLMNHGNKNTGLNVVQTPPFTWFRCALIENIQGQGCGQGCGQG